MSGAWVDKADNPGMANWELHSEDIYGAMALVNFAAMAYRPPSPPTSSTSSQYRTSDSWPALGGWSGHHNADPDSRKTPVAHTWR